MRTTSAVLIAAATFAAAHSACAEVSEVLLGQQFGAIYLPPMVMESQKLVEKHLKSSGMADVKVTRAKLGTASAINDAMISSSLHFSCQGSPSTAVLWDRTRSLIGVKAVGAMASSNIWLNTRNQGISSIKDITEKDRIAVAGLKVAATAVSIQYLAAQEWGVTNYAKLDHLMITLPHPESVAALLNPMSEINIHFATSPFHEIEKKAGMKTITTFYDIWGGVTTSVNFVSSEKFRKDNPKVYAAVADAFGEALEWINDDKPRAAAHYLELSKEKRLSQDDLVAAMNSQDLQFTRVPKNVLKQLKFLHDIGLIKSEAKSWKDLYLPEVHDLSGS